MSLHWNARAGKCEVRWREGRNQRARLFDRKGDARSFEADLHRRRQLGVLATMPRSRITLAEFMDEDWWPRHAIPNLAEDTRRRYLEIWRAHLEDRVGGVEVRAFTPLVVEDLRDEMLKANVPLATQRKALMLLQGILRRAVLRGLIPSNPAQVVTKPRQPPAPAPRPLAPEVVERIRFQMLAAWASLGRGAGRSREELEWWRRRNAIMVSLLAYGGLRPAEDTAARWDDLEGRTLHVLATKTGRARDVELLEPLALDLEEWRSVSGSRNGGGLIFPTMDGDAWKRQDWQNWRRRVYQPAAIAAGVMGDLRPYRLRGSFVSLLLWEGSLAGLRRGAGRPLDRDAGEALCGGHPRAGSQAAEARREAIAEARGAVFNSGQ